MKWCFLIRCALVFGAIPIPGDQFYYMSVPGLVFCVLAFLMMYKHV